MPDLPIRILHDEREIRAALTRSRGFEEPELSDRARAGVLRVFGEPLTAGQVVANSDLLTVLPAHFVASTGIADALDVRPLPLEVPQVHVDMLWLHRQQARPAHTWLRHVLVDAAAAAFKSRAAATRAP